jgi:regulator of protease activity HflC (stomatin/prohibitin superfamily)
MVELIALLALVVLALVVAGTSVRVIQQSTVGVVQRLGRYQRTLGPGVHLLVPMLDRVSATVDMK